MPAHLSAAAIGHASKSNSSPVTARDWRSNRLVDGLAKLAASEGAAPRASVQLVSSAEALVRHRAAQLAVATYNANNHKSPIVKDDGTVVTRTLRDSQQVVTASKDKKLQPLKVVFPTTTALDNTDTTKGAATRVVTDAEESSSSNSSLVASRQKRKNRARAARRKQDASLQRERVNSVIQQQG